LLYKPFSICFHRAAFFKVDGSGEWVCWLARHDTRWSYGGIPDDMTELPQEPETFVPVVGEECEWRVCNEWETVKVNYIGEWVTLIQVCDTEMAFNTKQNSGNGRPMKTDRERFIEQGNKTPFCGGQYIGNYLGDLYDNGARFSGDKS